MKIGTADQQACCAAVERNLACIQILDSERDRRRAKLGVGLMNSRQEFDLSQHGGLTMGLGLDTGPVPAAPYFSPSFFEGEKKRIFERAWLIVCREEELPDPGSYIVKDISPTEVSALITRSKAGAIQAFHNTCSHRGSQVAIEPQGRASRFVCPYHKWSYGNDGALLGVPDESNFFDLDKKKCGLTKIHTETWEGWVFINLAEPPEVSLEEYLGDFKSYFEGFNYRGVENPIVLEADLAANWKIVGDAFVETYHIPAIHPETLNPAFTSRDNPFGRLIDAKIFGPHRTVSMFGNPAYELDPANKVEALAAELGEVGSVIAAATVEDAAEYLNHPAINPTGSNSWSMDVNHVFPHVQIDSGPGHFWVHQFWPIAADRCRYEGRFYMVKPKSMVERFIQEMYITRVQTAICEDLASVERTHRGLRSGGKTHLQMQDSEIALRHHIDQCIKWVAAETVREALA